MRRGERTGYGRSDDYQLVWGRDLASADSGGREFGRRHRKDSEGPGPVSLAGAGGGLEPFGSAVRRRGGRHADPDVRDESDFGDRDGHGHGASGRDCDRYRARTGEEGASI